MSDDSVEKVTEWCYEHKSFTWRCHHQAALINSENTQRYVLGLRGPKHPEGSLIKLTIQALFVSLNGHFKPFAIDSLLSMAVREGGRAGGPVQV